MKTTRALLIALVVSCGLCVAAEPAERVYRNAAYEVGDFGKQTLDLYIPEASEPPPVIVWFHGGGWKYGDKRYRFLIRNLTREGFAVATVDYRLSPRAKWPAQRDDCLAAVKWLRRHAGKLGIDASRMGLAGDSAGGHLAALLGVMEGSPKIKAVFAIYPPTDLVELAHFHGDKPKSLLTELLGGTVQAKSREAREASPVNFVDAKDPPFLFLHGDRDKVVPLEQSRMLQRKLHEAGVEAVLRIAKGKGHAFVLDPTELQAAARFFRKNL
jgi:acetyl esterase/lipase